MNLLLVVFHVSFNGSNKIRNVLTLARFHGVSQLGLHVEDELVLGNDLGSLILSPLNALTLSALKLSESFSLQHVPLMAQILLSRLDILQVVKCNSVFRDLHVEISQLVLHARQLVSQRVLVAVLLVEVAQLNRRLLHGRRDVLVLVDTHVHGVVMKSQRVDIGLLALVEQASDVVFVRFEFLRHRLNLSVQVLLHLTVHVTHVQRLVLVVELAQLLLLLDDVSVNTKEGGDLFLVDVHEIFAVEILQQDLGPFSSVLRQAVQNVGMLLVLLSHILHVINEVVDIISTVCVYFNRKEIHMSVKNMGGALTGCHFDCLVPSP